jgi:hypothetical protein
MNAATFFGRQYVEATRKPGTRRHRQDEGEDEARNSLGMRPQGEGEDDSEAPRKGAQWTCASCGEVNRLRLPAGVRLAEDEDEDEGEAGRSRYVSARCSSCAAPHKVEAPTGQRFVSRKAAEAFLRAYRRSPKVRESSLRHEHLIGAMRVR